MSKELSPNTNALRTRPRSWREATQIVRDAAATLQAANLAQSKAPGVVPSTPGRSVLTGLKVIDFGVARFVDGNASADSIAGARLSSPAYMSPERCRGQHADARSDLYALTCRYYELLTGELPFKAADVATLQYEHCYAAFPDAAAKVPGLPEPVRRVLARGSEKEPAERYQFVAEMVADLNTLLAMSGTTGKRGAAKRLHADMPAGAAPSAGSGQARSASSARAPIAAGKNGSIPRKIILALLAIVAVGGVIAMYGFRDIWNPSSPPAEPAKPVARAPRSVPPSIPAATQGAASADPARTASPSPLGDKALAAPEPRVMAAYLRRLGIIDEPLLERGNLLRAFDFTRPIPPDEWPRVLTQMSDVEYVLFHNQSGTDEAVSHLASLPVLQRLSLGGEPVTDKAFSFLHAHRSLERLDLANTAVTGAALADIASIPNLTALDLRKTAVRGACWKPLMRSRVSSLWLADNPIEDRELADLARHPSLSMVQLSNTRVTNAAIDILATMPNFRQGDFADTRIDDTGVAKLSRLQNLVTLELSGCPIGENGLIPLSNLKKLRRLVIRNLPLSDRALESVAKCSQLEGLDLSGCRFNASGLGALRRVPMLRSLRVGGARIASPGGAAITRQMVDELKRKLPNLMVEGTPLETSGR